MNLKQLSILIVLVVLIGGLGLYLYQRNSATWHGADRAAGQKLMDFPLNDVAQVTIKQAKAEVNLVKQDDLWRVKERYNYPANFSELSEFLRKVWELKGVQQVPVGPSKLSRLDLVVDQSTNSGCFVELKDKGGKPMQSMLLGKKHMRSSSSPSPFGMDDSGWPDGRFILVKADKPSPENVWVVSEPFSNIEPKPESWINKDFVKIEKIRSVSVVATNATNSWKLGRDTESGEMKLLDKKDSEELDSSKIYGVPNVLSSASIVDVVAPDAKPEAIGMDKPTTATIDTFDHFTYVVQVGSHTNGDNYPVHVTVNADLPKERTPGKDEKPEDKAKLDKEFKEKTEKLKEKLNTEKAFEKWTFEVSKWTIDPLLKNRSDLLAAPKTNAPTATASTNSLTSITNITGLPPSLLPTLPPVDKHVELPPGIQAVGDLTNALPVLPVLPKEEPKAPPADSNKPKATNEAPVTPEKPKATNEVPVAPTKPDGAKAP